MTERSEPLAERHVVHLLPAWTDGALVPDLGLRTSRVPIVMLGVLLVLVSALSAAAMVTLWSLQTPGWWFCLMFSVVFAALIGVLWSGYVAAVRRRSSRAGAITMWSASVGRIRAHDGLILNRTENTIEDGSVIAFEITVVLHDGSRVLGAWRPRSARSRPIRVSQLPDVGADIRAWIIDDADADAPSLIDVLDGEAGGGEAGGGEAGGGGA